MSTMAVLPLLDSSTGDDETALPRSSVLMTTGRYAHGYAVQQVGFRAPASRRRNARGSRSNILRGPMMLPHRHTPGVINTDDLFTRLLYSVIVTGLAPHSFYRRANTRLPGAPGLQTRCRSTSWRRPWWPPPTLPRDGCRAVNLSAYPTRDGGSLDDIVSWIETAGYPVKRVAEPRRVARTLPDGARRVATCPEGCVGLGGARALHVPAPPQGRPRRCHPRFPTARRLEPTRQVARYRRGIHPQVPSPTSAISAGSPETKTDSACQSDGVPFGPAARCIARR